MVNKKYLIIFRHAIADERKDGKDSPHRKVTPLGFQRLETMSYSLRKLNLVNCKIVSSPYNRCYETALMLAMKLQLDSPKKELSLQPKSDISKDSLSKFIKSRMEHSLILVGHQPELSQIASLILTGFVSSIEFRIKKSGYIVLPFSKDPWKDSVIESVVSYKYLK